MHNFPLTARYWTKVYEQVHAPSMRTYRILDFSANPVILAPGQVRALYIHSSLPGDEAIVYDNASHNPRAFMGGPHAHQRATPRYEDAFVQVHSGKAHLSPRPFGQTPIWGWGNAWRDHREFVGQVNYGVIYQLWQPSPQLHGQFGPRFHEAVRAVLACQRRSTSPVALLPDECLYYILNMCRWDWFADGAGELKERRRQRERAARERALQQAQQVPEPAADAVVAADVDQDVSSAPPCEQASVARMQPMEGLSLHGSNNNSEEVQQDDTEMDPGGSASSDSSVEDEWQEDDDNEGEVEDEDDDDSSDWERQHGYRADVDALRYHDMSSDEDEDGEAVEENVEERGRLAWVRRHYARVHILRALAQAENGEVVVVDNMMDSDDDEDDVEGNNDTNDNVELGDLEDSEED
jgi:hypothetical protein